MLQHHMEVAAHCPNTQQQPQQWTDGSRPCLPLGDSELPQGSSSFCLLVAELILRASLLCTLVNLWLHVLQMVLSCLIMELGQGKCMSVQHFCILPDLSQLTGSYASWPR
jgi:hypothetical protein